MNEEKKLESNASEPAAQEQRTRRDFLKSLGRWSAIIIAATTLGGLIGPDEAAGWVNGRGGWINGRGGGGGGAAWVNRGGGSAGWVNRGGGWINGRGGAWVNRRGSWVNRY